MTTDAAPGPFGYRVWMVKDLELTSIAVPGAWHPGVNKATCQFAPSPNYRLTAIPSPPGAMLLEEGPPFSSHRAPGKNCMCGLWSVNHVERADEIMRSYHRQHAMAHAYTRMSLKGELTIGDLDTAFRYAPLFVIGAVRYWGRTAIHSDGVRAEYAQPVALVARRPDADPVETLAQAYDIPRLATKEELVSYVWSQE